MANMRIVWHCIFLCHRLRFYQPIPISSYPFPRCHPSAALLFSLNPAQYSKAALPPRNPFISASGAASAISVMRPSSASFSSSTAIILILKQPYKCLQHQAASSSSCSTYCSSDLITVSGYILTKSFFMEIGT